MGAGMKQLELDRFIEKESRPICNTDSLIEREMAAGLKFGPWHRAKILETKPYHVRKELEFAGYLLNGPNRNELLAAQRNGIRNTRGPFSGADINDFTGASFAAINTTITETNLYLIAMFAPIPAMTLRPGQAFVVECGGVFSTSGAPTTIWTGRIGQSATATSNTTLGPSVTTGAPSGVTNAPWMARFVCGVRIPGVAASTAVMTGNGFVVLGAAAATVGQVAGFGGTIASTLDATANQGVGISMTWGTSSASNTITTQWMIPMRSYN